MAFRTSGLLLLLLDFETYGGTLLGVFPVFINKIADIITPKLSIVFRRLIPEHDHESYQNFGFCR